MTLYGWLDAGDHSYLRFADTEYKRGKLEDWLFGYGVNPCSVWRFEIHLLDGLVLRVFEYDRNSEGRLYRDDTGEAAQKRPYDVLVKEFPPVMRRVGEDV